MRKQLYYALIGLLLGTMALPHDGAAESLATSSAATAVLKADHSDRADGLKKRKKRKKGRPAWRRRR